MAFGFGRKTVGSWRDRPCWRCGYPLRSLPGGDVRNCPECGLAVRISLNQNMSLAMSDPEWLAWQTAACVIAALAVLGVGTLVLIGVTIVRVMEVETAVPIAVGLAVLTTAAELVGWWLFASTPRHQPHPEHRTWAWAGRAATSVVTALLAAGAIYGMLVHRHLFIAGMCVILWPPVSSAIAARASKHTTELMRRSQHRRLRSIFSFLTVVFMIGIFSPVLFGIAFVQLSQTMSTDTARWLIGGSATVLTVACSLAWLAAARQVWTDRRAAIAAWVSD